MRTTASWSYGRVDAESAGEGRAKLRLSRGLPGCLACDVIPQKSKGGPVAVRDQMAIMITGKASRQPPKTCGVKSRSRVTRKARLRRSFALPAPALLRFACDAPPEIKRPG